MDETKDWDIIVKPKSSLFSLNFKEVWAYKDLIFLLVKRDITSIYKQTILGPLWMFIQPIFATLIYTFTFGQANLSTDGIPALLFYLMGQTFWNYFSECLNKTSVTFIANAAVFGKVYFPRLVMPISVVISNLLRLGIQLILMFGVFFYYYFKTDLITPHWSYVLLIPLFIVLLGVFSLSLGILFSSFTTKYRDFTFLLGFAVQLLMFLSCIVFPASMFKGTTQSIILCNPVATCLESIKYILTGHGIFEIKYIVFSVVITFVLLLLSIIVFNRTEKSFMDTV
jgi:lipopolysaccharide transport system permease protein